MAGCLLSAAVFAAAFAMAARTAAAAENVSRADAAARGEVVVVDIPWSFPSNRIDWTFNPTSARGPFNPEWTWQLNRMYFWTDMAGAYRATGDEKYARAFARQLEDWLDQTGGIPPESSFNCVGSPWRTIEEGLRLMGSWRDAWLAFRSSPSFPPQLRDRFVQSMRAQAGHLLRHRTRGNNWLLMEMNGVNSFATSPSPHRGGRSRPGYSPTRWQASSFPTGSSTSSHPITTVCSIPAQSACTGAR